MATNKSNRPNPGKNKVQNRGQTGSEVVTDESDDSIIGTMFWRSVAVLAVVVAVGVGIYFATRPSKVAGPEEKTAGYRAETANDASVRFRPGHPLY